MSADTAHSTELMKRFDSLPEKKRRIVELLSVVYEDCTRTDLLSCFRLCGIRYSERKAFDITRLTPVIEELAELGLLRWDEAHVRCVHPIVEPVSRQLRAADEERFRELADTVRQALPARDDSHRPVFHSYDRALRELRIDAYLHDSVSFDAHLWKIRKELGDEHSSRPPLRQLFDSAFDPGWLASLPVSISAPILTELLEIRGQRLENATEIEEEIESRLQKRSEATSPLRWTYVRHLILRGQFARARELAFETDSVEGGTCRGWLRLLEGDHEAARKEYETALQVLRKSTRRRKVAFVDPAGVFYPMLWLRSGSSGDMRKAMSYFAAATKQPDAWQVELEHRYLKAVALTLGGDREAGRLALLSARVRTLRLTGLRGLICALSLFWIEGELGSDDRVHLGEIVTAAKKGGYLWIAREIAAVIGKAGSREWAETADELGSQLDVAPLAELIGGKQPWEQVLELLGGLSEGGPSGDTVDQPIGTSRLVWRVKYCERSGDCTLRPIEQKHQRGGGWSKGRKISLERLVEKAGELDFLTPQDREICACIDTYTEAGAYGRYYGRRTVYAFDTDRALPALVGHPNVFLADDPSRRIEVVEGHPELRVERTGARLRVSLHPPLPPRDRIVLVMEGEDRLKVVTITRGHRKIAELLGPEGLTVPEGGFERVAEVIGGLSSLVTVRSDIAGAEESAEQVEAETAPRIRLVPQGSGLRIDFVVRPLGAGSIASKPGSGAPVVLATIDHRRLQAARDLEEERRRADQVVEACTSLMDGEGSDWSWSFDDPISCLELLYELEQLGDAVILEWPEGKPFTIRYRPRASGLRLGIEGERDWFSVLGELPLDEDIVLDLRKLLDLVEGSSGRFIEISEGQFALLTESFRRRLRELSTASEPSEHGVRVHRLAAAALEELAREVGDVRASAGWEAHLGRLEDVRSFEPKVPTTLKVDLRPYQEEGFQWLARLARWGVGACLADDMGLGKTLQALTLLLTRAAEGPALVIAPTSVCSSWRDEVERFAPTLRPVPFGPGDREKTLDEAGPFDLVICSYGLLQSESERLSAKRWATVVLDEGQAIKNRATKRSKAAGKLQADAKVIMTGTPIENHLGELWNLFRFLNPGLLGSHKRFNERFAVPIERDRNREARRHLKRLVQPFVLRRTKAQVLPELPPKTTVLRKVELSTEESSFYEALRRRALERLENTADEGAGSRHLRILAELTKLRRACCHPRLVLDDSEIPSAKLELLIEMVGEVLGGGHKALVFSQFVDHLTVIRERLDEEGVSYQYLDGSTPARERAARVAAFQAGEGDLFLISLKAGGLGLTLTAADYVFHMDPWWNPAVEDQGSDRTHRIGQQRPVTVYKLVAAGTIEERIIALHREKRDLAEGLLSGADMAGKVNADELLALIQER